MTREVNEVQSRCSIGFSVHPLELSSNSVGDIDIQLSFEQLMVDFTRLQETNVHIRKENDKLLAEILKLNDSGCNAKSKTDILKTNHSEREAKLVELANDQVVKFREIKQ
ncbi:hypothetical protein ACS0TY_021831 [Phlomoides rotata]